MATETHQDEPATQGQWARVLWLDREIREGRYPAVEGLQEEFGIGRRHAFNTVAFLRHSLGAPVAYSKKRGGYYYEDPTYACRRCSCKKASCWRCCWRSR